MMQAILNLFYLAFVFVPLAMAGWFGPRSGDCSCCGGDCDIAEDDFSSVDALTVDWEGDTGSFTKSGGEVTSTTSDKAIVHKTGHPDNIAQHIASASVKGSANGDQIRVIVDYVDSDNYVFGEVEIHSTDAKLRLYRRASGGNTQLGPTVDVTAAPSVFHTLKVCVSEEDTVPSIDDQKAYVSLGDRNISHEGFTTAHGGDQAGFGTGTITGTVTFDNFDLNKHKTVDDPDCLECCEYPLTNCTICPDCPPEEVDVVLSSFGAGSLCSSGQCTPNDGTYRLTNSASSGCDYIYTNSGSGSCEVHTIQYSLTPGAGSSIDISFIVRIGTAAGSKQRFEWLFKTLDGLCVDDQDLGVWSIQNGPNKCGGSITAVVQPV